MEQSRDLCHMNKLPPSLRASLLSDAQYGKTKRWSIQALAELNNKKISQNEETSVSSTPHTDAKRLNGGNLSPVNKPSKEVAECLIREVHVRLARQHDKCVDMISHVELMRNNSHPAKQHVAPMTSGTKRMIKAVNNAVHSSLRDQQTMLQECSIEEQKALKLLQNLQLVHADTYQLTHHFLNSYTTIQRFNKADQHVIEAALEQIRSRHAHTVEDLADVVVGMRKTSYLKRQFLPGLANHDVFGMSSNETLIVEPFLRERLGIQLLCDHYVGFCKGRPYGGVSVHVDLWDVIHEASIEAQHVCDANHGFAPEVHLFRFDDAKLKFTLIRPWVHHSLVEIFKNAMASSVDKSKVTMSTQSQQQPPSAPPINVRVINTDQQIAIQIIDEGVGLNDHSKRKAFVFAETSSSRRWDRLHDQQSYAAVRAPLASLGVGLPLSRMIMQVFGGDVTLSENNGDGCTAALILSKDLSVPERDIGAE